MGTALTRHTHMALLESGQIMEFQLRHSHPAWPSTPLSRWLRAVDGTEAPSVRCAGAA